MANIPPLASQQPPQRHLLYNQSAGIPPSFDSFALQMPVRADGSWAAPFALVDGGRQFVFFEEALATPSGRTRISLLETDADGRAAIVRPVIEIEGAVAAPFVFSWQERFWLLAMRDGTPWLYRCLRWPERWQAQAPLLAAGTRCTSGALHLQDGVWWLWLNQAGSGGHTTAGGECLHLYSAKNLSSARWQPHPINRACAVGSGSEAAAGGLADGASGLTGGTLAAAAFAPSAGCVFADAQGRLLRPVRTKGGCADAAATSGQADAITLYHVTTLTTESYAEVPVHSIEMPAQRGQIGSLNIGEGCAWADAVL